MYVDHVKLAFEEGFLVCKGLESHKPVFNVALGKSNATDNTPVKCASRKAGSVQMMVKHGI